ncbi:MAG: hypothetical protein P8107_04685 [Spirochaetia bacterium]
MARRLQGIVFRFFRDYHGYGNGLARFAFLFSFVRGNNIPFYIAVFKTAAVPEIRVLGGTEPDEVVLGLVKVIDVISVYSRHILPAQVNHSLITQALHLLRNTELRFQFPRVSPGRLTERAFSVIIHTLYGVIIDSSGLDIFGIDKFGPFCIGHLREVPVWFQRSEFLIRGSIFGLAPGDLDLVIISTKRRLHPNGDGRLFGIGYLIIDDHGHLYLFFKKIVADPAVSAFSPVGCPGVDNFKCLLVIIIPHHAHGMAAQQRATGSGQYAAGVIIKVFVDHHPDNHGVSPGKYFLYRVKVGKINPGK